MSELTQEIVCQEAWRHRDTLTAYAYAWLKDWSRADDVVQDAYLVMLSKWQEVTSLDGVKPWVRGIVKFKIMKAMSRGKREQPVAEDALEAMVAHWVEEQVDTDGDQLQSARIHALQECLTKVPEPKRTILREYYLSNRSCDQLAETQGSSSNAIAKTLSRLRRLLRECTELRLRAERMT